MADDKKKDDDNTYVSEEQAKAYAEERLKDSEKPECPIKSIVEAGFKASLRMALHTEMALGVESDAADLIGHVASHNLDYLFEIFWDAAEGDVVLISKYLSASLASVAERRGVKAMVEVVKVDRRENMPSEQQKRRRGANDFVPIVPGSNAKN